MGLWGNTLWQMKAKGRRSRRRINIPNSHQTGAQKGVHHCKTTASGVYWRIRAKVHHQVKGLSESIQ